MKKINATLIFSFLFYWINAQPATTANDVVPTYTTQTRVALNPGWHSNYWSNEDLADLAAGNASLGIDGVGMKSFRVTLPEDFLEYYGYTTWLPIYEHYDSLGLLDNVVFLQNPTPDHRDSTEYCPGNTSLLWKNMYTPIFDNGENGTPVNDTNYYALYVYKTVDLYKNFVKFWEIWNEPDIDYSGAAWLPPGYPGNWWENVPDPCDYKLQAPVYHYIRLLRISYEVIKTVDPDAFITVGGLGYESFLDICLRFTDNPVDGTVTTDYPLKGGAYFDGLSFHSYPHINGSLRYWDNSCGCFIHTRHSDAAVQGMVNHQESFESLLKAYGYGTTYPKKVTILTETNVPSKPFGDDFGSIEAQRNYVIKMMVSSYQTQIRHMAFYQLADSETLPNATHWVHVCGLYQVLNSPPYAVVKNESGIATKTTSDLISETTYDAIKTIEMNLPDTIAGGAFRKSSGDYIYVLWAKTKTDSSEVTSGAYSFPLSFNITSLEKREWDFSETNTTEFIGHQNIALTGAPVFLEESLIPLPIELLTFSARPETSNVRLNWSTASEENNEGFEIQYSKDGENWEYLDFMDGAGFSNVQINYEYLHKTPRIGWNYYRLKQIDFDEKYSYSQVEAVEFKVEENMPIHIFPNPTKGEFTVMNFEGTGYVFSMEGKLLFEFKDNEIDSNLEIQISHLPRGVYNILLVNKFGERINKILLKQN